MKAIVKKADKIIPDFGTFEILTLAYALLNFFITTIVNQMMLIVVFQCSTLVSNIHSFDADNPFP